MLSLDYKLYLIIDFYFMFQKMILFIDLYFVFCFVRNTCLKQAPPSSKRGPLIIITAQSFEIEQATVVFLRINTVMI